MGVVYIDAGTKELCFTWECNSFAQVARLMLRVESEIKQFVKQDIEQHPDNYNLAVTPDDRVNAWLREMLAHILSTPTTPASRKFRRDLLLLMMLNRFMPPEANYPPGTQFYEMLPLCDIHFANIQVEGDNLTCAAAVIHRDGTQRVSHM